MHSYVVNTKSSGKKNILALSSLPPILEITKDDGKCKPAILKFYDFTKGGTNIVDQRIGFYSVNSKSRRWPITVFSYILDTIRVNSQTIFSISQGLEPRNTNSFEFCWELVMALVKPQIESRKESVNKYPKSVQKKITLILGEPGPVKQQDEQFEMFSHNRARCYFCYQEANDKNEKICANKVKTQCQCCGKKACKRHSNFLCVNCRKK